MEISTSTIHDFYNSELGKIVKLETTNSLIHVINEHQATKICGLGYTYPYLEFLKESYPQALFHEMSPDFLGSTIKKNSGFKQEVVDEYFLPIEPSTIDIIMLSHILELVERPETVIEEAWRVLKPNGILISIVPRRAGLWTRYDNNPFGYGRSFSKKQLTYLLNQFFYLDGSSYYLYTPPWKNFVNYKLSSFVEKIGPITVPFLSGLKMQVSKKIVYVKSNPKIKKSNLQRNLASI
ncbi:class I SAM-dependent methyltransferase [Alphaproteobacteria bacterium]|nr:class I SAM-dependent methyltransferase [Alphaproteobacteria bacterium]